MTDLACPTSEQLSAYLLGKLDDDRLEEIDQHVSNCESCQGTIVTLGPTEDTLLSNIRSSVPDDSYEKEPGCEKVLAAIAAIGREPSFVAGESNIAVLTEQPELGTVREYRLLAKLGQGGMGTVYKALHTKLEKVVALKVLPAERMQDPAAVERFEREMKAVGKLDHPNIVAAHDAGEADGTHYLVMELVDGVDLSALDRRIAPSPLGEGRGEGTSGIPIADACELIRQAALGLEHASRRGMVHRDIKPSNLMLAAVGHGQPQLKILDMGLALLDDQLVAEQHGLTSTGQMMGTLDYMAPEQGTDSHEVDIRADIYSLGATLFKLLTGQPPFPTDKYTTPLKLMMAKAMEDAPSIACVRSGLPQELVAIVDRMLARSAEQRYATPQEVADALTPFCAGHDLCDPSENATAKNAVPTVDQSAVGTQDSLKSGSVETDPTIDMQSSPHAPREESGVAGVAPAASPLPATSSAAPGGSLRSTPATHLESTVTVTPAIGVGLPTSPKPPTEGLRETDAGQASGRPAVDQVARSGDLATTMSPQPWYTNRRTQLIATAIGLVAIIAAVVVFRIITDKGEIIVKSYDPRIEVTIRRNGKKVDGFEVAQRPDGTSYYAGEYEIVIDGPRADGVTIKNGRFTLTRDDTVLVEITREGQVASAHPTGTPPFAVAPFNAEQATQHQQAWADYLGVPVEFTNSIGMKFRLIPPGEFTMGSTQEEVERVLKNTDPEKDDSVSPLFQDLVTMESPERKVRITQPFYLGTHEVTQQQYAKVMGNNPSRFTAAQESEKLLGGADTANHPVEMVTWYDANEFCHKLLEHDNGVTARPRVSGYRLPTEAEWEYACRAGTTTRFWSGDNEQNLPQVGWFAETSDGRTHAVGELKSNPFGLCDVHGNVQEWCQDCFGTYDRSDVFNPKGVASGSERVYRGGHWRANSATCRSASRDRTGPIAKYSVVGFRVVLPIPDELIERLNEDSQVAGNQQSGTSRKATTNGEATASAVEPATFKLRFTQDIPRYHWVRLAFSPDGKLFARSAGASGQVKVYDADTGDLIQVLRGHYTYDTVGAIAFSADSSLLAAASYGTDDPLHPAELIVYRTENWQERFRYRDEKKTECLGLAFSPDGSRLARIGRRLPLQVHDVASGKMVYQCLLEDEQRHRGIDVAYSPNGKRILCTYSMADPRIWDAETGELIEVVKLGDTAMFERSAFLSTDKIVVGANSQSYLVDLRTNAASRRYGGFFALAKDQSVAASRIDDDVRKIVLWSTTTNKTLAEITGHHQQVNEIAISSDGRSMASASEDGTIKVWDLRFPAAEKRIEPATVPGATKLVAAGDAAFAKGDLNGSLKSYSQAIENAPDDSQGYRGRGWVHLNRNDYAKALEDFNRAIQLDGNNGLAFGGRGWVYHHLGKLDEGLSDLNQAVRLLPNYSNSRHARGVVHYELKKYDEAIRDLTEAIRLDPTYAWSYLYRSRAYEASNDTVKAEADRKKALELDPSLAEQLPK